MSAILEKYVNVDDAAAMLGVTVGRIRQLLLAGTLAGEKINNRAWLVEKASIHRHMRGKKKIARRG